MTMILYGKVARDSVVSSLHVVHVYMYMGLVSLLATNIAMIETKFVYF